MNAIFETNDKLEIAKIVLKQGDVELTSEYRESLRKQKLRRIIDIIHRNAVDPKTGLPHPVSRIENAIDVAKVKIDEIKSAEKQIDDVLKALRPVLPLKFEIKEIEVVIPAADAAKAYGFVRNFGDLLKENWNNDGSWTGVIRMAGGLELDFYEKLNNITHGKNEVKVLSKS